MSKQTLSNKLRNLARGRENYRHLRWRVFNLISENPNETIEGLSPYLAASFFDLLSVAEQRYDVARYPLSALQLKEKDWDVLRTLERHRGPQFARIYLRLVADYIISNKFAVERLHLIEGVISNALFRSDILTIASAFKQFSPIDKQSLFFFKIFCATNAESHKAIAEHFAKNRHSDWVRQRLLWPMIFNFINLPTNETLHQVVGQMFGGDREARLEQSVVKFLLNDELGEELSLSSKCYLALLCHPYDALEILTAHFETLLARGEALSPWERDIFSEINAVLQNRRTETVLRINDRTKWAFEERVENPPIITDLGLDAAAKEFLVEFISGPHTPILHIPDYPYFGQLSRLRSGRYPIESDFVEVLALSRRYSFCRVGRLTAVLMSAIYMVERRNSTNETRHLFNQLEFFGCNSPFTICSPRGVECLDSGFFGDRTGIETKIDATVCGGDFTDRWWIKALHWSVRDLQRTMKIKEWLRAMREGVPLSGNSRFLSGIDWQWVDNVIQVVRIRPFQANADGIYVLLLRAMEQRQREPNTLRLAIAPIVIPGKGLFGLVEWLMENYGQDTTAFVRFFLTPAMMLKLKLVSNYTAAVSERLDALDLCASEYGFNDDVMTKEQYAYEQRALTTTLTFMTLGSAQFELPWDAYRADARNNAEDDFKTYSALNKTYNELPLLSQAQTQSARVFANKAVRTYEFKNQQLPLVATIQTIIDTFLTHPSYGIESILAIRIRHDNLRRELASALSALRKTYVLGLDQQQRDKISNSLAAEIYTTLQAWIDTFMHTKKSVDDPGLFEFLPTQSEMEHLLIILTGSPTLDQIVSVVTDWIRTRLDECLSRSRESISLKLKPDLERAIKTVQSKLAIESLTPAIVKTYCGIANDSIQRKADELSAWFQMPVSIRKDSLSFGEMKLAVEGRFSEEVDSGQLTMSLRAPALESADISPEKIRPVFDLWAELITNAIKYNGRTIARLHIRQYTQNQVKGLLFSSLCSGDQTYQLEHAGVANVVSETALRAGRSGFDKVATLSAAIMGCDSRVRIEKRRLGFHVFVPLVPNK